MLAPAADEADEVVRERLLVLRWRKAVAHGLASARGADALTRALGRSVPTHLSESEGLELLATAERTLTQRWAETRAATVHLSVARAEVTRSARALLSRRLLLLLAGLLSSGAGSGCRYRRRTRLSVGCGHHRG